jgi:predicted P-loop ATPase
VDDDRTGRIIDMASLRPIDQAAWFARLQKNRDGAPLPTVANAMMILSNDKAIKGMLAYNAFTSQHLLMQSAPAIEDGSAFLPGPYPRVWEQADIALTQGYMQRLWCPKFARATVEDAMVAVASSCQFHPVKDWLNKLTWDGKPRIDLWLVNTFDCDNDVYHKAVGAKFLIAAIRRIMWPGCKFDYMVVLEGCQGIGKSTVLRALFGDKWFSDAIPVDLSSKDAAMSLLGIWCLEFSEIEHLVRTEIETIKAFVSRQVDRFRPPYGKGFVDRPRQGIMIGTTNSDDYLRDTTGNRRFWPVRCRTASVDWISVNRDQEDRLSDDMWTDAVCGWLVGRHEIRIPEILSDALNIPRERQGKPQEMRAGKILRKLKWSKSVKRRGDDSRATKIWFAPGYDPDRP